MSLFVNLMGWIGAALVLGAYWMVTRKGVSFLYHLVNAVGSAGLIVNALYYHSFPSVGLNVAWIGIAIFGMTRVAPAKNID